MQHNPQVSQELHDAVHALLVPILSPGGCEIIVPRITGEMAGQIASLGELIALARSHVERDRYSREIVGAPITEGNTRLPQQLCQLARGSALLENRAIVADDDLQLACRAALDSLHVSRRAVLVAMIDRQNPYGVPLPATTVFRALEDLQAVGLVHGASDSSRTAELTRLAAILIEGTGMFSAITDR
jgi:hypothetical protein